MSGTVHAAAESIGEETASCGGGGLVSGPGGRSPAASTRTHAWARHEQGSRDWRMLGVAALAWMLSIASWYGYTFMMQAVPDGDFSAVPLMAFGAIALGVVMVAVALGVWMTRRHRLWPARRYARLHAFGLKTASATLGVLIGTLMLVVVATVAAEYRYVRDAATVLARSGGGYVSVTAKVNAPARSSAIREADCQVEVRFLSIEEGRASRYSGVDARVHATGKGCAPMRQGAVIRVSGMLRQSPYSDGALWLTAAGDQAVNTVAAQQPFWGMTHAMQQSFAEVTQGLSEQGRVLVPGLTIGMLGQDIISQNAGDPVDANYAALLESRFKQSGIMHLMAVSGGHFALIAALTRRLCAWVLVPRRLVIVLALGAQMLLACAMYPSDSVLRALAMGCLAGAAAWAGRRPQAMSALSWTVLGVLIVDPSMSRSFGFALSCAAVLGIVVCAQAVACGLSTWLPPAVSEVIAVSVSAQVFTLPIQILIQPELPLLSVFANLIVWPVVNLATLTGLVALLLSPLNHQLAFACAWVSSGGTALMEWCANWLGGQSMAVVPWAGGLAGAVMIIAIEAAVAICWRVMARMHGRAFGQHASFATGYRPHAHTLAAQWLRDTRSMLE